MPTGADSGRNFEILVLKKVYSAKYLMVPVTIYPYTDDKRIFELSPFCKATEDYLALSRKSQKHGGIELTGHGAALWTILEKDLATERWTSWSLRGYGRNASRCHTPGMDIIAEVEGTQLFPLHDYLFVDDLETREADIPSLVDEDEDDLMDGSSADMDEIPNFNHSATAPSSRPYIPKEGNACNLVPAHLGILPAYRSAKNFQQSPKDIINDYCQMRDLPVRDYMSESFQETLNLPFHNWKISYAQIICCWTSATITEEEYERVNLRVNPVKAAGDEPLISEIRKKLKIISFLMTTPKSFLAHRELIHRVKTEPFHPPMPPIPPTPYSSSPPIISSGNTSTSKKATESMCDCEELLRAVAPSSKKAHHFHRVHQTKAAATEQERRDTSSVQMEVLGDKLLPEEKVSCRVCRDKKMDEHCVHILEVDKHPDMADLVGAVLTCTPPDDHL
ncbi:hypothetical protein B0H14DRAFT_2563162 [Mycena olivaceomarginata]|nr:hypothetical protein B0H14DRAFT_2563162 [Mycena olivaceomarginata]